MSKYVCKVKMLNEKMKKSFSLKDTQKVFSQHRVVYLVKGLPSAEDHFSVSLCLIVFCMSNCV